MLDRLFLNLECEQRRILQLTEAPLVRIGDERHALWPDKPARCGVASRADRCLFMADQQPGLGECLVKTRTDQLIIGREIGLIDLPVEDGIEEE